MILFTKPTQTKIFEYEDAKFTVYPKNSKEGLEAEYKMQVKIFQLMAEQANQEKSDEKKGLSLEFQEKLGIEFISDLIVGWEGITEDTSGDVLPCTTEYKNLLLNQKKVLAENIMLFCSKVDAFPKSKKKS